MFAAGGGYAGVDFDDCLINGELSPDSAAAVRALDSYTEISPSGTGVKVWVRHETSGGGVCEVKRVGMQARRSLRLRPLFHRDGAAVVGDAGDGGESAGGIDGGVCRQLWPEPAPAVRAATTVCHSNHCTRCREPVGGDTRREVNGCSLPRRCILAMPESISGERGHDALLGAACTCWRFALTDEQAWQTIQRFNVERCPAGDRWSEAELRRKLVEGRKKVEAAGQWGELLRKEKAGKPGRWHNHLPAWIDNLPRLRPFSASFCRQSPTDATATQSTRRVPWQRQS